jgi:hypothetical protein
MSPVSIRALIACAFMICTFAGGDGFTQGQTKKTTVAPLARPVPPALPKGDATNSDAERQARLAQLQANLQAVEAGKALYENMAMVDALVEVAVLANSARFQTLALSRFIPPQKQYFEPVIFPYAAPSSGRQPSAAPADLATVGGYLISALVATETYYKGEIPADTKARVTNLVRSVGSISTKPALKYILETPVIKGIAGLSDEALREIAQSTAAANSYIGDSGSAALLGQTYDAVRIEQSAPIRAASNALRWSLGFYLPDIDATKLVMDEAKAVLELSPRARRRRGR